MIKTLLPLAAAVVAMIAGPAFAAKCAARDTVVERLQSRYSETLAAGGLQAGRDVRSVMEIWASASTGSYTVLVTSAEGVSCIVATGTDYFGVPPGAPGTLS